MRVRVLARVTGLGAKEGEGRAARVSGESGLRDELKDECDEREGGGEARPDEEEEEEREEGRGSVEGVPPSVGG